MCTVTTCEHFQWLSLVLILSCVNGATSQRRNTFQNLTEEGGSFTVTNSGEIGLNVINISVPQGLVVYVEFQRVDMNCYESAAIPDYCECVKFEVYDGPTVNESALLVRDCHGYKKPGVLISSSNSMLIQFSGKQGQGRGNTTYISAKYRSMNTPSVNTFQNFTVTEGRFSLTRMGKIGTNVINIFVPQGHVVQVVFETLNTNCYEYYIIPNYCDCIKMEIYDGPTVNESTLLRRACGNDYTPRLWMSSSNSMLIQFTGKQGQRVGNTTYFTAIYKSVNSSSAHRDCGGKFSDLEGSILYPGFPNNYLDFTVCEWVITVPSGLRVQIVIEDLDIESSPDCAYDSLEIFYTTTFNGPRYGPYCTTFSTTSYQQIVEYESALVRFTSNWNRTGKGFRARWTAVCENVYSGSSGLFYSPSNLNVIKTSFKCVYVIQKYNAYVVRLTFQTFLLGNNSGDCETNYIEIRDGENEGSPLIGGRLCGNTPPPAITGTQSAMWILFATNGSSSNQSFTAYFTRLQAPVTCFQCQKYQKCVPKSGSSSQACVVPGAYFYGFGPSEGDLEFEEDGQFFRTVIVPDGFPFSSSTVKQVFIRVNGLVSLNNSNTRSSPQTGRVDIMPQVCSNWTDPQLNSSDVKFKVWYQAYLKTNITTSNQKSVFTKANSDVKMFMDRTLDATFVLVVTYAEMPPENGSVTRSERVNFQTVLITDGSASYSMIMYWTDEMQWNKALNGPFTLNCIKETLNRNKHRPYTIIEKTELPVLGFESIGTLPARTNPELECKKWHDKNMLYKKTIDFIIHHSKLLPTCPCNVTTSDIKWISENASQSGFQCFLNPPSFLQFGMRCCYTSRGSYEPNYPNSGSFLLNHPLKNYEEYNKEDVIPKKHCCEQSHLCCLYYDVRPNISCTTNSMHTTETVSPNTIGTSYQDKPCSALQAYTDTATACSPKRLECNHSLIIGLAVGVPLFSVFVVIIFLALYCNNKRPKFEVTNIFRRPSYGKPNERRKEENRSNALGVPERVTRAQLQSISLSIASVRSVNEVYAEIGDVPEYLEILNTPVHNQIQDTPLVKYNRGIPRDTVTQPAVCSKRFPAWNKPHAQPVPARKITDTYLYPIPTVYERNGATDFKSDYLHPVYYPSRP